MAYDVYFVVVFYFLVVALADGEEELVVVAAVEGVAYGEHVVAHLAAYAGGLIVDGYALFIDFAAAVRVLAEVEQFGGEAVADVDHGGGYYLFLLEKLHYVETWLGLEEAFEYVVVSVEVGLEGGVGLEGYFLAFEDDEAGVGAAEVTADADEVVDLCAFAIGDLGWIDLTDGGDVDDETHAAGGGVAASEIYIVAFAAETDASVELFEGFDAEPIAYTDGYQHLGGLGIHGGDVA